MRLMPKSEIGAYFPLTAAISAFRDGVSQVSERYTTEQIISPARGESGEFRPLYLRFSVR
jgi:hypothetical protein